MTSATKVRSPEIYVTLRDVKLSEVMPENDSGGKVISFVACEETPVERWDWFKGRYFLIFSHDPNHVRLDRVQSGACMFIEDHDTCEAEKRIGKVISAAIDNKQLKVEVRLNSLEAGQRFYQEVLDKTEPPKSIGAAVYETEVVEPALYEEDENGFQKQIRPATLRAIDWELMEISAVTVPAVPNAATKEASSDREYETLMHGDPGMELNIPEIVVKAESQTKSKPKAKPKKPTYPKGKPMKTNLRDEFLSLEQEDLVDRAIELQRKLDNAPSEKEIEALQAQISAKDSEIAELKAQVAESENLKNQLSEKNAEIAKLTRQQSITDKYTELRSCADRLNQAAKLSAVEYESIFAESARSDIERLLASNSADTELASIEFYLQKTEARSPMLKTEIIADSPLPEHKSELSEHLAKAQSSYEQAWRA